MADAPRSPCPAATARALPLPPFWCSVEVETSSGSNASTRGDLRRVGMAMRSESAGSPSSAARFIESQHRAHSRRMRLWLNAESIDDYLAQRRILRSRQGAPIRPRRRHQRQVKDSRLTRTRWRILPRRSEVGERPRLQRRPQIPHRQLRGRRTRTLQRPSPHGRCAAQADRGCLHSRLRLRHSGCHLLHQRRGQPVRSASGERYRAGPKSSDSSAITFWALDSP